MQSPHPSLQPVLPRDCSLALAVPLTREEFLNDLSTSKHKDFAQFIKRTYGGGRYSDVYYWNNVYKPVIQAVLQICEQVEQQGVRVIRNARLSDFTSLCREFQVVSLVSHWRFAKFEPDDITNVFDLLHALQHPQNLVQEQVQQVLKTHHPELLKIDLRKKLSSDTFQHELAGIIDRIITEAHSFYSKKGSGKVQAELAIADPLTRLVRAAFEQAFPGLITPSPAIEFSECLYTVAEVVEAVPLDFRRLIDLTICNSVILGEAIKYQRPDCLVTVNRYPANLLSRIALYRLAISLIAQKRMPFAEALSTAHIQMREEPLS